MRAMNDSNLFRTGYQHPGARTPTRQPRRARDQPHNHNNATSATSRSAAAPRFGRTQNAHGGRGRSRSPVSQAETDHSRRQRQPLVRELPEQDEFHDPYVEHDRFRGRRGKSDQPAFKGVEFNWAPYNLPPTALGMAIRHLIDLLKATKLSPRDIDGAVFRSMPEPMIKTLGMNWNAISAHIFGRLYEDRYKGFKSDISKIMANLEPGVVITTPILERLMDDGIAIDNLERSNGMHGASITKHRTALLTQADLEKLKIEVRPCYGFNNREPPGRDKEGYVRLIHIQDSSADVDEKGNRLVHYNGNNHLIKPSYFLLGEPFWISVKNTPCAIEGSLVVDDFPNVAKMMQLPEDHPFVEKGEERKVAQAIKFAREANHQ